MTQPKRILIPEIAPLQRLAADGESALNRLFDDGAEVWIADLVEDEIMRGGAETEALRAWVTKNRARIRIVETDEGAEHKKAMAVWRMLPNSPPELRPSARRIDVLSALDAVEKFAAHGRAAVLCDDRKINAAIAAMADDCIVVNHG